MSSNSKLLFALLIFLSVWGLASSAAAQTPGYSERVIQWTVKSAESCEDIAAAVYGSTAHKKLIRRYNNVPCTPGAPLKEGLTLVLPAKVTKLSTARITTVNPETVARPRGGAWSIAYSGQALSRQSAVNTREKGRAGIKFVDRSQVHLAERTLVVIYGSASESRVSRSLPNVELKSGELQAGLAALRGGPLLVGVDGGGSIAALSKDTVVNKQGERTNVSVFDGHADVSNAGKTVRVPARYGTRFVAQQPPQKPRPLPPAPIWQSGGSDSAVLAIAGKSVIRVGWKPVPDAAKYRVEVARDTAFTDLVVRQQVPAKITAFVGENLPPDAYYLRVAAIDTEDFLGLASDTRAVELVKADWTQGSGTLSAGILSVGTYSVLSLDSSKSLRVSIDDNAFGLTPSKLDFRRLRPKRLRFRDLSQRVTSFAVAYVEPKLKLAVDRDGEGLRVDVGFSEVEGLNVAEVISPKAMVVVRSNRSTKRLSGDSEKNELAQAGGIEIPLTEGQSKHRFSGVGDLPPEFTSFYVFVRDGFGRTLVSGEFEHKLAPKPPTPPELLPVIPYRFGSDLGPSTPSARTNVRWTEPWARQQAVAGVTASVGSDESAVQANVYAAGSLGRFSVDAALTSPRTNAGTSDSSGWFGLSYLAHSSLARRYALAPTLRLSVPLNDLAPRPRLELLLAAGGAMSKWRWLVNVGGRVRLGNNSDGTPVDPAQGFLLLGGNYAPVNWAKLNAHLDLHLLFRDQGSVLGRGGLTLGAEAGERVFVGINGRITPWNDADLVHFSGQIAVGFRELSL